MRGAVGWGLWVVLSVKPICNDLCQEAVFPQTAITTVFNYEKGILKESWVSVPGIGHSDIRGLVTNRSMVRRERYRLIAWITYVPSKSKRRSLEP